MSVGVRARTIRRGARPQQLRRQTPRAEECRVFRGYHTSIFAGYNSVRYHYYRMKYLMPVSPSPSRSQEMVLLRASRLSRTWRRQEPSELRQTGLTQG